MDTLRRTWTDRLAVFDLETTGVDPETCRIVTAHLGVLDGDGHVVGAHDWLLDPGVDIPEEASAIHGVTTARARAEGMRAHEGVAQLIDAIAHLLAQGVPLVAYNAAYDLTVLDREAKRYAVPPLHAPSPVIDPYVIDKALDRYRRGKRTLSVTAAHYGVDLDAAHEACADAVAAGRVALALADAFPELHALDVDELHARQVGWARDQAAGYQAWRRANGSPDFTTSGAWPSR
ncbi:3'-5' exonuclease [Agromyces sp. SYSU T00194]|uniref:3'-5' exonuclease n=1 Tax=Agromyces chitinivorans TaxID=3158560 RepID=UPI003399EFF2